MGAGNSMGISNNSRFWTSINGLNIFPTFFHTKNGLPKKFASNLAFDYATAWELFGEFIGCLLFQLIGGGMGFGFMNGLILMVLIFVMGPICSASFNPAVSLGLMIAGQLPAGLGIAYMIAEILGCLLGALLGGYIFYGGCHIGDYDTNKYGLGSREVCWADSTPAYVTSGVSYDAPDDGAASQSYDAAQQSGEYRQLQGGTPEGPGSGCVLWEGAGGAHQASSGQVFLAEMFGTFLLMMTIMAVAIFPKNNATFAPTVPIAIGFALLCAIASVGAISGGAFNPAREIAPAIVFGCGLDRWYVYWVAEFVGAALAAFLGNVIIRSFWKYEEDASGVSARINRFARSKGGNVLNKAGESML